jgi:hypothetical protein
VGLIKLIKEIPYLVRSFVSSGNKRESGETERRAVFPLFCFRKRDVCR